MTLDLAPQANVGNDRGIAKVGIRLGFDPGPLDAGEAISAMPLITANVGTFAPSIMSLRVSDKLGC